MVLCRSSKESPCLCACVHETPHMDACEQNVVEVCFHTDSYEVAHDRKLRNRCRPEVLGLGLEPNRWREVLPSWLATTEQYVQVAKAVHAQVCVTATPECCIPKSQGFSSPEMLKGNKCKRSWTEGNTNIMLIITSTTVVPVR